MAAIWGYMTPLALDQVPTAPYLPGTCRSGSTQPRNPEHPPGSQRPTAKKAGDEGAACD
ncbi:hypothetical protein VTJ49DRAFT_5083 [Mycothermus thermophilus]|uniref:Uncharacterized protein n=1 Tax=Humicola insolens TaxID=85995 RepID=A0ABR3V441_HUMIN